MKDILITTPKSESENSRLEAEKCIKNGSGYYFRYFNRKHKDLDVGSKIFYVDRGFIRGFSVVDRIESGEKLCETTGRMWPHGFYAIMPASSWRWISPIPQKGFQGFYYCNFDFEVIGDWKDPMPIIKGERNG
jgi:hypothetical protein